MAKNKKEKIQLDIKDALAGKVKRKISDEKSEIRILFDAKQFAFELLIQHYDDAGNYLGDIIPDKFYHFVNDQIKRYDENGNLLPMPDFEKENWDKTKKGKDYLAGISEFDYYIDKLDNTPIFKVIKQYLQDQIAQGLL